MSRITQEENQYSSAPLRAPDPTIPLASFVYKPPRGQIAILHLDDEMMIVEKPSGLLSVAGKDEAHRDCLESRLQNDYPQARIVHRLDMDTSGLMVLAMNRQAHRHLGLQFERRHVEKTYQALVDGLVVTDKGCISLPLRCDWPNRPRQIVDHQQGRNAETSWQVIARQQKTTRLALQPKTGRSHQLRVHMLTIGHPILGDNFYAPENIRLAAPRLCLHACRLGLFHPAGGVRLTFQSECPF